MSSILPVLIETPYSASTLGGIAENVAYAWEALLHSYSSGKEAPVALHLLYTRISKDGIGNYVSDSDFEKQLLGREHALSCALAIRKSALTVLYVDRGMSSGMKQALAECCSLGLPYEIRTIYTKEPTDEVNREIGLFLKTTESSNAHRQL